MILRIVIDVDMGNMSLIEIEQLTRSVHSNTLVPLFDVINGLNGYVSFFVRDGVIQ